MTNDNDSEASVLAIIPARGCSKGIPRKNVLPFGGFPLIAYSIVAGLRASTVDRVIVSTDNEEIASVARDWGAEVPFLRPAEFAQDLTPDLPVFQHALAWLQDNEDYVPDLVVHLRPPAPVRPIGCVDEGVNLLCNAPDADSLRALLPSPQNPYKMWRIEDTSGFLKPLLSVPGMSEPYNMPRQSLPASYWHAGHLDVIRRQTLTTGNSMTGSRILPMVLEEDFALDLDTPHDWRVAEGLLPHLAGRFELPERTSPSV